MKKSSSLALVCLLLSSIALVSVIPSDDSNGGNDHDSQTRMIPRELAHHSSCSSCPDKAVGALKKAKRGTSQVLSEARESLGEFIEKTLVERDPVHAAGAGMETASTLGKDVLSNATKAGAEAAMDQEAVTQVGRKPKDTGPEQAQSPLMRLLQVGRLLAGLAGLLGCATAYGMCVWIVFVTGPARTGATPRWQLPAVERVVAGVYCRAMAWCVGGAALGHFVDLRSSGKCEGYNLLVSLLMVLVNLLYLKPRATKALLEKIELEKEGEKLGGRSSAPCGGCGHVKTSQPLPVPLADGPIDGPATPSKTAGKTSESLGKQPPLGHGSADTGSAISTKKTYKEETVGARVSRLNARIRTLNSCLLFLNMLVLLSLTWHLVYLGYLLQRCHC